MLISNHKRIFLIIFSFMWAAPIHAQELRDPGLDTIFEKVKEVYGVTLHYAERAPGNYVDLDYSLADVADKAELKRVIILFIQEMGRYPENFFRAAHCEHIYFVQKLFFRNKPVDGLFSERTNYIFYDYSRRSGHSQKIRHNIQHEFFHMIGSRHPFWKENNANWESLNYSGFVYNAENRDIHQRNPLNALAPPEPGFITNYAMASPEEDRAEVYACMMLPEENTLMAQWAQKDRILFRKIELMQEFLRQSF